MIAEPKLLGKKIKLKVFENGQIAFSGSSQTIVGFIGGG